MIHTKPQIRQEDPEELSFKTELSPIDEAKFKVWYGRTANTLQIAPNPDDPLHYYDYRGYWQENPIEILELGDHFTDKFKVPGHPTFSEESQYSSQKGGSNIYGGKWDGKRFVHSKDTDLHAERTQEYFDQQGSGEYPVYQGDLLDMIEVYPDEYKRGGPVSSQKAKKILRHGKVYGKGLTQKQKRYFGFIAGGGIPKYQQSDVVGDVDPPITTQITPTINYAVQDNIAPLVQETDNLNISSNPSIPNKEDIINTTTLPDFPLSDEEVAKRKQNMKYGYTEGDADYYTQAEMDEIVGANNVWNRKGQRWSPDTRKGKNKFSKAAHQYKKFQAQSGNWKYLDTKEKEEFFKNNPNLKSMLNFNDAVHTDLERFYMDYVKDQELADDLQCLNNSNCLGSAFETYDRVVRNNPDMNLPSSYGLKEGLLSENQKQVEDRFKNATYNQDLRTQILDQIKVRDLVRADFQEEADMLRDIPEVMNATDKFRKLEKEQRTAYDEANPYPESNDGIEGDLQTRRDAWWVKDDEFYRTERYRWENYDSWLKIKDAEGNDIFTEDEKRIYKKNQEDWKDLGKRREEYHKKFYEEYEKLTDKAVEEVGKTFADHPYVNMGPDNFSINEETGNIKVHVSKKGISADSWTVHGALVAQGGKNIYNGNTHKTLERNNDGSWRYPKKAKELFANMPVGTVIGMGQNSYDGGKENYNRVMIPGMGKAGHSTVVVGFAEDGMPIIYDHFSQTENYAYDTDGQLKVQHTRPYRRFDELPGMMNYEVVGITVPKNAKDNTFAKLSKQGLAQDIKTTYDTNYVTALADSLANGELGQAVNIDRDTTKAFVGHLGEQKGIFTHYMKMKDGVYDELANIAVALGINETEGGGGILSQPVFDQFGESQGFTQLKMSNIMGQYEEGDKMQSGKIAKGGEVKDEVLHSAYKKLNKEWKRTHGGQDLDIQDPGASAALTMLYLSEASKRAEKAFQKGLSGGERTFWEPDLEQELKGTVRGGQGGWGSKGFFVEGADGNGERIDTDDYLDKFEFSSPGNIFRNDKERREGLQEKLNETYFKLNPGKTKPAYIVKEEDGRIVIKKTTKGNNPNLTKAQKLDYYWQSGNNTLESGDAQGGATRGRFANKVVETINGLQMGDEEASITSEEESFERGGKVRRYQSSGDIDPPVDQKWVQEAGKTAPDGQTRYVGDDTYEQKYSLPPFTVEADRKARDMSYTSSAMGDMALTGALSPLSAIQYPAHIVSQAYAGAQGKPTDFNIQRSSDYKTVSSYMDPNAHWGTKLGVDIATDPLSWLTVGGTGAAKTVGQGIWNVGKTLPVLDMAYGAAQLGKTGAKYAGKGIQSLMNSTQGRKLAGQLQNQAHVRNITMPDGSISGGLGDAQNPTHKPHRIEGTQAELDAEFNASSNNVDSYGNPLDVDDFPEGPWDKDPMELGSNDADIDAMFETSSTNDAERAALEDMFSPNNARSLAPGISQNAQEINDLLKTDAIRNINKTPFDLRVSASPAPIKSIKDVNRAMGEGMQIFDEAGNLLTEGQARNLISQGKRVNGKNPFQNADELTNNRRLGGPGNKLYMQLQNPKTKMWHDIGDHSYSPHVTPEGNFVGYKRKGHFPFNQLQGRMKEHPLWETISPYNKAGVKGQSKDEMYELLAKQLGKSVEEVRSQSLLPKHIGEKGDVLPLEGTGIAGTFQKAVLESMKRQGKGIYSDKVHTLKGIKQYLHQLSKGRVKPVGLEDASTEMLNKAMAILGKEDISKLSGKEISKLLPGIGSPPKGGLDFNTLRSTRFKHIKNRGGPVNSIYPNVNEYFNYLNK